MTVVLATLPVESMTMSRITSPAVPWASEERSGFGLGKNAASAMLTLPSPRASDPAAESGCDVEGELVFCDEGAGLGVGATSFGGVAEAVGCGADLRRGREVWAGARPGRYAISMRLPCAVPGSRMGATSG